MSQDRAEGSTSGPLVHTLLERVTSSWMAQAIHVAAELRIADLLANGPRTSEDLATATGSHGPSLDRLLRALTTIEICRERDDGSFEMTAMGSLLATEAPGSLRSFAIWWGTSLWQAWGHLLHSVKTGQSARQLLAGKEGFTHLAGDPAAAAVFNQALVELTRLTAESVTRAYDFSGLKRIVDVGGGYGELLRSILRANPSASGVLFDLPHAIEGARGRFDEAELAGRCELVTGDFFLSVPAGADAYVLKSVVHDWNDERSRQILETCRRVMPAGARLLVVERVLPDRVGTSAAHQAFVQNDLTMLVAHAAGERTETEFRDLLGGSRFRISRILPADAGFSVIEAFPLA